MTTPDERVLNQNTSDTPPQDGSQPSTTTRYSFQAPLLPSRTIIHHPKAGLNPIADAAAHLFSIIGKLKQLKSYRHLSKLHQELMQEVQIFQNAAKAQGYNSEHILVSRYALCATLDDIIQNTSWGSQGEWDQYSLLAAFHPDTINPDRFFIILERVIKEPSLYIDILELMYICLSLGFKGPYRAVEHNDGEYNYSRLEQILQNLYQQIRAYRGDFHKNLSPFSIKPTAAPRSFPRSSSKSSSMGMVLLFMSCFILIIMSGLGYSLGTMITQINKDLTQIGKLILYEIHD